MDRIAEAVDRMPALDKRGTYTGPTWEEAAPIFDVVADAGRDGVLAVVGMLKDVDDGADYKARLVLHGLAQYLGRPGQEARRAAYVAALVSALGGERPKSVQGFLVRQLQIVGDSSAAPALGRLLADPELHEYAAQALLAIRNGAVEEFRKALPDLKGALRLTVVQALGVLADAASAEALRADAAAADADLRHLALWALARIGDPGAVDLALKAADATEPRWDRLQAAALALQLADRLLETGRKAEAAKVYGRLKETRDDPSEAYLRDLAAEGLMKAG
jgi:HEAT repeat protein